MIKLVTIYLDIYLDMSSYALAEATNTTTPGSQLIGYSGLLLASVLWGANNLPVKHYETGNGMFFQFIVGIAIWSTGIVIHALRGFPKFQPFALLGGFFWSMGNLQTVPVIRCLGIGVGSLFSNIVGLIVGWLYARFGLFGVSKELPSRPILNYVGVTLAVASCVVLLFVRTEEQAVLDKSIKSKSVEGEADFFERMSQSSRRALGTGLSIFSGVMYGLAYMPVLWCQDNIENTSRNQNDYAFAMSTGIFLSSGVYFCVYAMWTRNQPKVYPEVVLPSLAIGWIWGIANTF